MKILTKIIHGSKLYGLDGPESDTDYKAIFLPAPEECLLMRATKNETYKIKEENVEYESFALQVFLRLCANSEDITIAMLHAPDSKILIDSDIYRHLRENKKKFYTKRMVGALGYARSQNSKYALRADRMKAVEDLINILENAQAKGVARIYQIYDDLPTGEYYIKGIEERNNTADKRYFECAGKKVTATVAIEYALDIYKNLYNNYGDRVKIAKNLDGKDYKAISHSFRVAYQLLEIFTNGGFEYPLKETAFIKNVKYGKLNYLNDNLDKKLDDLLFEVERAAEKSSFPEKVDQKWLDKLVLEAYGLVL